MKALVMIIMSTILLPDTVQAKTIEVAVAVLSRLAR